MRNETKQFSSSIKGMVAGALGLGAIIQGFRTVFVEMDRVHKLGRRFGETAETIQRLGMLAKVSGADLEDIAGGLADITEKAFDAARGGGELDEMFDRLGLSASEFFNLSGEEKLIQFAYGLERTASQAEGLAITMKLMGGDGEKMFGALSLGGEEVARIMHETAVATQAQVDAVAEFSHQLDEFKQTAVAGGAAIFPIFRAILATIGGVVGAVAGSMLESIELVRESTVNLGHVFQKVWQGDLAGAIDAAKRIKLSFKDALEGVKANIKSVGPEIQAAYDEIFEETESKDSGKRIQEVLAAAEEAKKIEEERISLVAEIAKLEEDARKRQLSLAEKILEAEKQRAMLAREAESSTDENSALEARKQMLEVEKELEGLRSKQAAEEAKSATEQKSKNTELEDVLTREKEVDRENRLAAMSDAERIDALSKERDAFREEARTAEESGDEKGASELRTEAKKLDGQISGLQRTLAEGLQADLDAANRQGPVISTSSLAEIGGGGNAVLFGTETRERRKVELLAEIVAAIRNQEGGTAAPIEPAG